MTSHTAHPDTLEAGLADGCPRCAEHAESPLTGLDRPHIEDLWKRMLACEYDPFGPHDYRYRTETETKACHRLYDYAQFLRSIGVSPHEVMPGRQHALRPLPTAHQETAARIVEILDRVEGGEFALIVSSHDGFAASVSWGPLDSDESLNVTQFRAGERLGDVLAELADAMKARA